MVPQTSRRTEKVGVALGVAASVSFVAAVTTAVSYLWAETAPLPLLLVLAVAVALRARLDDRARLALMGALVTAATVPSLAAVFGLSDAIVYSHWRCGTGDIAALFVFPFFAGFVTFAGALVSWALAKPLVGLRQRVGLRRIVPVTALPAVLAGAVLVGAAASTTLKPTPEEWLASLPTVGVIPDAPKDALCFPLPPFVYPEAKEVSVPNRCTVGTTTIAGHEVERQCPLAPHGDMGCDVRIDGDFASGFDRLSVREIELRSAGASRTVLFANGSPIGAIEAGKRGLRDVTLRDVAGEIDTAKHFLPAAVLGLLLAFVMSFASARSLFARRTLAGFEDATLDESGWLQLGDDRAIRASVAALPPPGLVHVSGLPGAQDYRDVHGSALRVRGGTLAAARDACEREARALATAAVVATLLGLGPLLFALFTGHVSLG